LLRSSLIEEDHIINAMAFNGQNEPFAKGLSSGETRARDGGVEWGYERIHCQTKGMKTLSCESHLIFKTCRHHNKREVLQFPRLSLFFKNHISYYFFSIFLF
jgi:hypothetical protein